jgi:hypothetical protein
VALTHTHTKTYVHVYVVTKEMVIDSAGHKQYDILGVTQTQEKGTELCKDEYRRGWPSAAGLMWEGDDKQLWSVGSMLLAPIYYIHRTRLYEEERM